MLNRTGTVSDKGLVFYTRGRRTINSDRMAIQMRKATAASLLQLARALLDAGEWGAIEALRSSRRAEPEP